MRLALALLASCLAHAAVDGVVTNATTGKPQGGVIIQMVQPGAAGMQTLGTVRSGADGAFKFDGGGTGGSPVLLQAIYQGVMYTQMVPPGSAPSGVRISVNDATTDPSTVKSTQHIFILQPSAEGITVEEVVFVTNSGNKTYYDPKGTYRFYTPDNAVGTPRVSLTSPDGRVPVQREPSKTNKDNVYSVDWAMKPGETQIAISYAVQAGADRMFKGRVLDDGDGVQTRVVVPAGVEATGDNLSPLGQDPRNKATIYDIKGKEFAVVLKGSASEAAAGGGEAAAEEDTGAPQVESSRPRIYNRLTWILVLSGAILAIGFGLLYRASPRKGSPSK